MKKLFDLSGKVCVVTGGAGLMGRAYVQGLASFGATVYIAEIDASHADLVARELTAEGLDVKTVTVDIRNEESVARAFERILVENKRIDAWVNNAYPRTKDWELAFEKVPFSSWRQNVDWHLNGYCLCCQKVAEVMKAQKKGSIINIGSTYGIVGPDFSIYEGTPMTMPAAYSAIKGALINFTRYLASYYGAYGVRANCLSPGGILDGQPAPFVEAYCRRTPLKRMGTPEDMVGAVVFLASDASSYVTGHNLVVDGGWTVI